MLEYSVEIEAVCAMLQPEKLRLSPDKYREKLEGINTGYQNAKDIHEQEQSAYEAELYEIETVWHKKMLDKAEDKLSFVIQIMQGVNGLYNDNKTEREEAFFRLEQLRKKGTVVDDDAELASYREEKYGK